MNVSIDSIAMAFVAPILIACIYAWIIRPRLTFFTAATILIVGGALSFALSMFVFVPLFFRPFAQFTLESESVLRVGACESLFAAAIPEELARLLVLLLCCAWTKSGRSLKFCVQMSVLIALGFAAIESVWWSPLREDISDDLIRVIPTIGHSFLGIIMGSLLANAFMLRRGRLIAAALVVIVPTALHFLFDIGFVGFDIEIAGIEELADDQDATPEMVAQILGVFALFALSAFTLLVECVWSIRIIRRLRRDFDAQIENAA